MMRMSKVILMACCFASVPAFGCGAIEGTLTKQEVELLKTVKSKESAAGITNTLLMVGPIATIINGNAAEMALNVAITDWKVWGESGNHLNVIASKRITDEISLWRLDNEHSAAGKQVFDCIYGNYKKNL